MGLLSVVTMLVAGLIVAVSVMFLIATGSGFRWGVVLASIGMAGIAGSGVLIWSDRRGGRHGLLGLGLAVVYCGLSFSPPFVVASDKFHGPLALALVVLAACNLIKHRLKSR